MTMQNNGRLPRLEARGSTVSALVRRVYLISGRPFLDCWDPLTGQTWHRVPLLTQGGGRHQFSHAPLSAPGDDQETVLPRNEESVQVHLLHGERDRPAVAAGALYHPATGLNEQAPSVSPTADHPGEIGMRDWAWVQGDAKLILDEHGQATLIAGNLRVQLPTGGLVRLSRDGEAGERLVLAGPLIQLLQGLLGWASQVSTYLSTLQIATPAGPASPAVPFTAQPPTMTPATLQSSTVHISSMTEAGGG